MLKLFKWIYNLGYKQGWNEANEAHKDAERAVRMEKALYNLTHPIKPTKEKGK